jgi:hypothetical protein
VQLPLDDSSQSPERIMNTDAPEVSYCQKLEVRRPSFSQCSNDFTPDFALSS